MSDVFLGQIQLFALNFAPRGWAFCQGQTLPITQNTALFSLLGTLYGGNGTSTFALPDLRTRIPIDQGQLQGGSAYTVGQVVGSASVTLTGTMMPAHTHTMPATSLDGSLPNPTATSVLGATGTRSTQILSYATSGTGTAMAGNAVAPAGGSGAHNNVMPYLTLNYCIALQGIYPQRN